MQQLGIYPVALGTPVALIPSGAGYPSGTGYSSGTGTQWRWVPQWHWVPSGTGTQLTGTGAYLVVTILRKLFSHYLTSGAHVTLRFVALIFVILREVKVRMIGMQP